jgi:hypothetical protein
MLLFWPLSFFNYIAEGLVAPIENSVPWFAFALRTSLVIVSGATTLVMPFFLFLTLVNSSDPMHTRVALSLLHAVWWSLVISIVGSVLLVLFTGAPALILDFVLFLIHKQ